MEREQGLFRTEAVDACRGQRLGVIEIATPLSRWIWTALGVALAAAIVAFTVFGHYTRRDRVSGQLVPSAGLLGVTVVHGGTVTRVFVHGGESVQQGDPLLEISAEQSSAALGSVRADISRQQRSRRQRLQDNPGLQKRDSRTHAKALKVKLHLLTAQQRQIVSQLRLQKRQAEDALALQMQQQHVAALQARAAEGSAPQAVVAVTGRSRQQSVYRIRVALDHQSIVAYGEAQALDTANGSRPMRIRRSSRNRTACFPDLDEDMS